MHKTLRFTCHSRENGNPVFLAYLDSRFRRRTDPSEALWRIRGSDNPTPSRFRAR